MSLLCFSTAAIICNVIRKLSAKLILIACITDGSTAMNESKKHMYNSKYIHQQQEEVKRKTQLI